MTVDLKYISVTVHFYTPYGILNVPLPLSLTLPTRPRDGQRPSFRHRYPRADW